MPKTPKDFQDALVAISMQSGLSEQLARAVINNSPARHYALKVLEQMDMVNAAIKGVEAERDRLADSPVVWVCFPRFAISSKDPETCMGLGKGAEVLISKGLEPKRTPRPGHENCGWKLLEPSDVTPPSTTR